MEDIYNEIERLIDNNNKGALATIILKKGSAPREEGAKLLVKSDGKAIGSIMGGCVEAEVWKEALYVMNEKTPKILDYTLTERDAAEDGLICGGKVKIFIEPILSEMKEIYEEINRVKAENERAALAKIVSTDIPSLNGKMMLIKYDDSVVGSFGDLSLEESVHKEASRIIDGEVEFLNVELPYEDKKVDIFIEPICAEQTIYIFGAGHISQYLSKIAKMTDFRVVVIDDRVKYANRERFPEADEIYVDPFEDIFKKIKVDKASYLVIVTRGHTHDGVVLKEAVNTDASYIGMIGSRAKIRALYKRLEEEGVSSELFNRVHAPIGIDINSETPPEIAISIMAEIIKIKGDIKKDKLAKKKSLTLIHGG
jgi:xanthine dehydrogenase accessory factor